MFKSKSLVHLDCRGVVQWIFLSLILIFTSKPMADDYLGYLNKIADEHTALIVIDMYCSETSLLPGYPGTCRRISELSRSLNQKGGLVVSIHEESRGAIVPENVIPQDVRNSRFVSLVKPTTNAFSSGQLGTVLISRDINRVIIAGAYTDLCIREAAISALRRGYFVGLLFGVVTYRMNSLDSYLLGAGEEPLLNDEVAEFNSLLKELGNLGLDKNLSVICSPSRGSDRDDYDPENGYKFGLGYLSQKIVY